MAKLADAADLKSADGQPSSGFESRSRHVMQEGGGRGRMAAASVAVSPRSTSWSTAPGYWWCDHPEPSRRPCALNRASGRRSELPADGSSNGLKVVWQIRER